jgi:hypothetical protein
MSNRLRYAATLLLLSLLAVQPAGAQETRGMITGRVSDATSVIPDAKVTAAHTETNTNVEAVTTGEGTFTLPYLAPGHYTIAVELEGFKRLVRSGIELRISDRLNLDLQMEVIRTLPSRASNFRGQPTALLDLSVIKNFEFS